MSSYILILSLFVVIFLTLFLVLYLVVPTRSILEKRLDGLADEGGIKSAKSRDSAREPSFFHKLFGRLGSGVPLSPKDQGKYRKMLVSAGLRGQFMPIFLGSKVFFAIVLPGIYIFVTLPTVTGKTFSAMIVWAMVFAIIGFLAPSFWLKRKIKSRQEEIFYALPDVLDLMTVCVEAGLSIDAAMIRISDDEQFAKNPMSKELRTAVQETLAGKDRYEALRDMGDRSGVDDLRSFASMLIQTVRLGTSLAVSLRVFSDSLRTKRSQLAEERAAKTSVKLLFPLIFFLMPAMFVVLLLPALIRLSRFFSQV